MSSQSTYVYGLIRAEDHHPVTAPAVGDPNQPVAIISSGGIAALVSAIDQSEIMPTRRQMLAHTKVLEVAMADRPVLPMRFGIIVPSPETLLQVIGPRSQELRALLGQIDGRIEVALKASWNEQFMWREVAAEHPHLAVSGRALMSRGEQQTYYDRIELGRAISAALDEKREAARRRLLEIVTPVCRSGEGAGARSMTRCLRISRCWSRKRRSRHCTRPSWRSSGRRVRG